MARYGAATEVLESGLVLKGAEIPEYKFGPEGAAQHSPTVFEWVVVVSQQCDLERDKADRDAAVADPNFTKQSNLLRMVLVCPAFPLSSVQSGTYLSGAKHYNGAEKRLLDRDGEERYHLLRPEPPALAEPLVVDFRLVTGAHPAYLRRWLSDHLTSGVCVLLPPYRDRLIQRFVGYLARIPEPDEADARPEVAN